jgi:hypothetical protein
MGLDTEPTVPTTPSIATRRPQPSAGVLRS